MYPKVNYPTTSQNEYNVEIDGITYYYSYKTVIAYRTPCGLTICENMRNNTTGRHLIKIDRDHSKRIPYEEFVRRLDKVKILVTGWGAFR